MGQIHRGELLKKAVEETNTKKSPLARYLKVSRQQLYVWFEWPDLNLDILIRAGKYMHYDFGKFVPELKSARILTEEEEENLAYKLKYFEVLEKYTQLLEEKTPYKKEKKSGKKQDPDSEAA